jgi:hypothetical protein
MGSISSMWVEMPSTPPGKPNAGFIDERDAQDMESIIRSKLKAAVISEGEASSVSVSVSRTDNLLATSTLNFSFSCVPKGYAETIRSSFGLENPALRA